MLMIIWIKQVMSEEEKKIAVKVHVRKEFMNIDEMIW